MTKNEYLLALGEALRKSGVADAEEIKAEYEQHFAFKLADGFTEEEIAARLEPPKDIAAHYESIESGAESPLGGKTVMKIAMGALIIPESLVYLMFFVWVAAMSAVSLACAAAGVCLLLRVDVGGIIPYMPYLSAFLHGVCMIALGAVLAFAALQCFEYFKQIIRASIRSHAIAAGKTALPPLSWIPQFQDAKWRKFRRVFMAIVIAFGVSFVVAYAVSALQAGSFEYWHAWSWFVG